MQHLHSPRESCPPFGLHEHPDGSIKPILRSPKSPSLPKSRKVQFVEMDEGGQRGVGTASPSGPSKDPTELPTGHHHDVPGSIHPSTSHPGVSYPYCYYYNPYPYPQYHQQWGMQPDPTQSQRQAGDYSAISSFCVNHDAPGYGSEASTRAHDAPSAPSPSMAATATGAGVRVGVGVGGPLVGGSNEPDPKRMHLMAKSVSITVNQGKHGESNVPPGAQLPTVSAHGSGAQPHPSVLAAAATALKEEQLCEARSLIKAQRWLQGACLLRSFKAWRRSCEERWWKTQIALRDQQLQSLAGQVRHLEWRPVRYLRRYRMKTWVQSWKEFCVRKKVKRMVMQRAAQHADTSHMIRATRAWAAEAQEARQEAQAEQRAAKLHARRRRMRVFRAWYGLIGRKACKLAKERAAGCMRTTRILSNALGSWAYLARYYATAKASLKWLQYNTAVAVLKAWREQTTLKREHAGVVLAFQRKHRASLRSWVFLIWRGYMDGRLHFALAEECTRLREEAQQMREDNQRLSRVIDSGDWGRDRVAELTEAGRVLQQERDALIKLVESLPGSRNRRGSRLTSVHQQHDNSKNETLTTEPQPEGRRGSVSLVPSRRSSTASIGTNGAVSNAVDISQKHIRSNERLQTSQDSSSPGQQRSTFNASTRNKMTVRAGSSFNALVRALKQDLLASGALTRDPEAAFAVDKLSTHHVHFLGDDEVNIEAAGNSIGKDAYTFSKAGGQKRIHQDRESFPAASTCLRDCPPGGRSVALSVASSRGGSAF